MAARRPDEQAVGRIDEQAELQQVCRLELWAEIEGQLRVLNSVLHEIGALRDTQLLAHSVAAPLATAEDLSRHVQTMKGWVKMLDATVAEADTTIERVTLLLKSA